MQCWFTHHAAVASKDVLPDVPELFYTHRLDEEVAGAMGDPTHNSSMLSIRGHHCTTKYQT